MISRRVLWLVLTAEGALVVAGLVAVAAHALWLWRRARADAPRLVRGRAALAEEVAGDAKAADRPLDLLRRMPPRLQRRLVEELAVSVAGAEAERIGAAADDLGLVAAARRRTRSQRWWRRLLGAHQLNVYRRGADRLAELFDDPHPAVRAQAIERAGDEPDRALAGRLAAALHDPSPRCRHTAADSILRAGAPLVEPLAAALGERTGREQADLLAVLARRPDPRYEAAALAAVADGDLAARRAAGAALLGGIGGADAAGALRSMLDDSDAAVREAAADALRRLGLAQAVPDLAPLLRDRAFAVRRAAGAALAALGPGGELLLRRYLDDADPYAADMARYALDVAALKTARH